MSRVDIVAVPLRAGTMPWQPILGILQVNSRSSEDLTSLRQCAFSHGGLLIHARRECMATPVREKLVRYMPHDVPWNTMHPKKNGTLQQSFGFCMITKKIDNGKLF